MRAPQAALVTSGALVIGIIGPFASELGATCTPQVDNQATHWFEGVVEQGLDTVTIYVQTVDSQGDPLGDNSSISQEFLSALQAAINQWKGEGESGQTTGACSSSTNIPKFQFQVGSRDAAPVPPAIGDARQAGIQLNFFEALPPQHSDEEGTLTLADHDSGPNVINVFARCPFEAGVPCNAAGNIDWVNPEKYGEKVLAHEIGHSLGFAHDTCAQSIMRAQVDLSELGGAVLGEHCSEADELNRKKGEFQATADFVGVGANSWVILSISGDDPQGGSISDAVSGRGSGTFTGTAKWPEGSTVTSYSADSPTNEALQCTATGHTGDVTGDFHYTVSCACENCPSSVLGESSLGFRCGGESCDLPEDPLRLLRDHCSIVPASCYAGTWGEIRLPRLTTYCYRVTQTYSTEFSFIDENGDTQFGEVLTIIETTTCKDGYVTHSTPLPDGLSNVDPRSEDVPGGVGPITAVIEPPAGEVQSGVIEVSGIARDDVYGTGQVALWIDNEVAPVQNLTWGQPFQPGCVDLPGAPASSCNANMGWSATLDTRLLSNGIHKLQVVAVSGRIGAWPPVTYAEKTFEVYNCPDTTPPSVSLDYPSAGSGVTGTVEVTASASDNVGVTQVRLLIDGVGLKSDSWPPYEFSWDSTTVLNGEHQLSMKAFDACGNVGASASTPVSVWNPIPGGPAIRVEKAFDDGARIFPGNTVSYPEVNVGEATSKLFYIRNDGDSTLELTNASSLVSDPCWHQISPFPESSLVSGATTSFRIRLLCNDFGLQSATVTIQSNDADDPAFQFALDGNVRGPDISVAQAWDNVLVLPGSIQQFPVLEFGASDSNRYVIHNEGGSALNLTNGSSLVSGECFQQIESPTGTLQPGEMAYFRVRLLCETPGTHVGTVSISSNDPDEDPYTFSVRGTILPPPDIRVSQSWNGFSVAAGSTQQFPSVESGDSHSSRYTIHNDGEVPLNLSNVNSLVSGTCFQQIETPVTRIYPGATSFFRVRFYCPTPGTYTGTVSITSDDPDESPYLFSVRGTITAPPPDIRVTQAWDGALVSPGATQQFPTLEFASSDSDRYAIHNDGEGTLTLTNRMSLVSGTCFQQIETPVVTITPGGTAYFRVRFFCSTPGTHVGTISVGSNDPDESPYTFFVRGTMLAPPDVRVTRAWNGLTQAVGSTYSFPTIQVGASTSSRFAIHNDGSSTLYINNWTSVVSGTCFQQVETPANFVPPGGTTYVRVRLFCSSGGSYSGTVSIASNDPNEASYWFRVSGTVQEVPPDISLSKAWNGQIVGNGGSYTFPVVSVGSPKSSRFAITNSGAGPLNLSNASSLVSGTCFRQIETPTSSIPAGGTGYVRVRLFCGTAGSYTGLLRIFSNDPDESPYTITLYGTVTQ